jgi:peroxiredoxin
MRVTFIIDENGVVERVIDKVKTKEHAAQILEGLIQSFFRISLIAKQVFAGD